MLMMHNFAVDIELVWDELFNESVHKIIDKKVRAISAFLLSIQRGNWASVELSMRN